jgi:mannose-6-phosphate isomerase-like protein (cupin superfamily)
MREISCTNGTPLNENVAMSPKTGKDTTMQTTFRPYALDRDEREALWAFGSRNWIKATAEQTGGAFTLIEGLIPPGAGSPWHVHHDEDESFYVVDGQITFLCSEERIAAGPGTFVYGPREVPHGFRAEGTAPARMLLLATPGGFDQFVLALSEPAQGSGFPPPGPPDMERLMAVAARHHIEILGPLPE